jgi:hypothetical protein
MATPYTGSFIATSCNSRSSHGQVHPFTKWDKVRCYVLYEYTLSSNQIKVRCYVLYEYTLSSNQIMSASAS